MEPTSALHLLPETHARALTLEAEGLDAGQLAARLDVDVSSVGPLLRVARAKLAALESLDDLAATTSPAAPKKRRKILRRIVLALSVALVALVVAAVAGPYVFIHFIEGAPPAKLSFAPANTNTAVKSIGAVNVDGVWKVAPSSKVGYRVRETLMGQDTTAVGRTTAVTGAMRIADGSVRSAVFTVDVTKIKSNLGARDNVFRSIFATATYPTATFTLTTPIMLATIPADLHPITVRVEGSLRLRGVTNPVAFDLKARRHGAQIEANGLIPVTFANYGIANPTDMVASVGDTGAVEFLLSFTRT